MAVDEMLLESAADGEGCALRFYRWSEPTLSLGYFQRLADRTSHEASRQCPLVRRASGGGAILHDRELTYSLVVPADHRLAAGAEALVRAVHTSWVEAVASLRIRASLYETHRANSRRDQPFLCFQRRASGDIVIDRQKIVGSAQRRRRGAVLQHGSCLLETSSAAPEALGLADVAGVQLSWRQLIDLWLPELRRALQVEFVPIELSTAESVRVREVVKSKYGCAKWTERR